MKGKVAPLPFEPVLISASSGNGLGGGAAGATDGVGAMASGVSVEFAPETCCKGECVMGN